MTIPRRLSGAFVACATVSAAACTIDIDARGFIQHDRKTFAVTGAPEITLSTFDGPIEIRGSDRRDVEIEIEKRAGTRELVESIEIAAEQEGNRIRVEARRTSSGTWSTDFMRGPGRSVRLVAFVPRNSQIVAQTGDGTISAERVEGRIELRTGDGNVRGVDLRGALHVITGDGSVRLDAVDGQLDIRTSDGSIAVSGQPTSLRLHTDDGSMTLRVEDGASMADDWELSTNDGRVVVYLPRAFATELDAMTGDGRVHSDLPMTDAPDADGDRARRRRELRGRIGAGGHALRIRTSDGSITIRPS